MKSIFNMAVAILLTTSSLSFAQEANQAVAQEAAVETPEHVFEIQVTFASGARELNESGKSKLADELQLQIDLYKQLLLDQNVDLSTGQIVVNEAVVESRTDIRGEESSNLIISQQRAENLVKTLKVALIAKGISFDSANFSAEGLGESEADQNSCKVVNLICRHFTPIQPMREIQENNFLVAFLNKVGAMILPSSHALTRQELQDYLFPEDEEQYEAPLQEESMYETEFETEEIEGDGQWLEETLQPEVRQCEPYKWDESCLAQQRRSNINIVLQFKINPTVVPVEQTTEQAVQPVVESSIVTVEPLAPLEPPKKVTTVDMTEESADESTSTPATETPAAGPAKLNVYGTPLGQ